MTIFKGIIIALGAASIGLTAAPAIAQDMHHDDNGYGHQDARMRDHHDMDRGHEWNRHHRHHRHCRTEWHHHHRVTRCR